MTTPTGVITLNDVAVELGDPHPITLGQTDVRSLAGVPSGVITLGQLRGKSKYVPPPTDNPPPPPPPPSYPAAGTLLSTFCGGTTLWGNYADGNGSYSPQIIRQNATECGYNPYPPYGTLINVFCTGDFTMWGNYNDGSGGIYQAPIQTNAPYCGYVAPPARGTFLRNHCYNENMVPIYADGNGGEYAGEISVYNSPYCSGIYDGDPNYNPTPISG